MENSRFAMSFPDINGEPVMQGHVDYCAAHGHASHTIYNEDGTVREIHPRCPRCGEPLTTPEEAPSLPALATWGANGTGYRDQEGHNFLYIGLSDSPEFPYMFESVQFPSYHVAGKQDGPHKIITQSDTTLRQGISGLPYTD